MRGIPGQEDKYSKWECQKTLRFGGRSSKSAEVTEGGLARVAEVAVAEGIRKWASKLRAWVIPIDLIISHEANDSIAK